VIQFCSDMFGPDIPWLTEFSPLYKRKVGLPFTCNHRVNLITPELVRCSRMPAAIRYSWASKAATSAFETGC